MPRGCPIVDHAPSGGLCRGRTGGTCLRRDRGAMVKEMEARSRGRDPGGGGGGAGAGSIGLGVGEPLGISGETAGDGVCPTGPAAPRVGAFWAVRLVGRCPVSARWVSPRWGLAEPDWGSVPSERPLSIGPAGLRPATDGGRSGVGGGAAVPLTPPETRGRRLRKLEAIARVIPPSSTPGSPKSGWTNQAWLINH
jgi:hypothetical protein